MVKRCCVYNCSTNYRTELRTRDSEKIPVYRFPNKKKKAEDRQRWIDVIRTINANLVVHDETVICRRHWPENCRMITSYGKERPVDPPSIICGFRSINKSSVLKHIKQKHLKAYVHYCSYCNYSHVERHKVRDHIHSTHSNLPDDILTDENMNNYANQVAKQFCEVVDACVFQEKDINDERMDMDKEEETRSKNTSTSRKRKFEYAISEDLKCENEYSPLMKSVCELSDYEMNPLEVFEHTYQNDLTSSKPYSETDFIEVKMEPIDVKIEPLDDDFMFENITFIHEELEDDDVVDDNTFESDFLHVNSPYNRYLKGVKVSEETYNEMKLHQNTDVILEDIVKKIIHKCSNLFSP